MKNWLKANFKLLIMTVVALVLVIILVLSLTNQGNSSGIGRLLTNGITAVQEPISNMANGVVGGFKNLLSFRSIARENEALKGEVADLKQELIDQKFSEVELEELRRLSQVLNYESVQKSAAYVTGDVIAMDASNWFNIFTINIGENQGVKKNAIVVNGDGLIGRVYEVGDDWAKIISIIDETNNVSFKIFRGTTENYLGILSGNRSGSLSGYMLDAEASVIEGDTIVTSGIGIYPFGITVGKVKEVVVDTDSLLKNIVVEPAVDFKNIQQVTVVMYHEQ